MKLILCLLLAPLPSIIWLAFYLRKDKHPEPNKMIIKIFFLGVLSVPLAGLLEHLFFEGISRLNIISQIVILVIGFAFIEEFLKYLVVKFGALRSSFFDEPVDAMIYMIIAALGFAAAENIYLLSQAYPATMPIGSALEFISTRFLGATFLHALASGIIGYFLAASLLVNSKIRKLLLWSGILIGTILHSIFNYIIILNSQGLIDALTRNFYLLILLVFMAITLSFMFKKINKHRSICKI
ncbi:MAG: PrsW family intramembrane metalloprotease [Candidatus Portnoybacteria bacterium]|nr:PrsW family intramembrane metalloprotease [Candidatus Portnoybacteria bacterium]